MLKNCAGVLLVMVAGLGATGALAAFGIGALLSFVWWPRSPRDTRRQWLAALANRDLWRRAVAMAGAQGMVSLFVVIDVVLVALLPGERALTASYQASATLSRIPYFVAGGVALAFFPSLSRGVAGGAIAARAVRMYAVMALPVVVVLATIPAPVLAVVFPTQYGAVATLLKYTAVTGLAAGAISLVTAFFQAAGDYSFLWWLGAGLAGYVGGLLAGWRVGGITGLAAGGALGATAALALAGYRLVRRHGCGVLAQVPLAEPVVAAAVLIVLRPHPLLWLAAASLVGLHAAMRFVRPGARHARAPRWAVSVKRRTNEEPAVSVLIDAVWRGTARKATDAELHQALVLARRNRVEGRLALAYPAQLSGVLAEARVTAELFARNLRQVASGLQRAGIPAVLIEVGRPGDHVDTSIDLVIPEQHWHGALTALADWYVQSSTYQLEHSAMALLHPSTGPGLHLHTSVASFGVPVLPTRRLLARARKTEWPLPHPSAGRLPADLSRPGAVPEPHTGFVEAARRVQLATSHGDHSRARRGEPGRVAFRFRRRTGCCGWRHRQPGPRTPCQPAGSDARVTVTRDKYGPPAPLAPRGGPQPAEQEAALQVLLAVAQRQRR